MRIAVDLIALVTGSAVLVALAELTHELLGTGLNGGSRSVATLVHAGLIALALAPLFVILLRQQSGLRNALRRAGEREQRARATVTQMREALVSDALAVFDHVPASGDMHILGGSEGARHDERVPLDDWLGRSHPEDRQTLSTLLAAHVQRDTPEVVHVFRAYDSAGDLRWLSLRARATERDPQRRAVRVMGTLRDVTPQRVADQQLASSRRLLHAVLELLPVAVFWKDREGRYLGANRAFLQHYGQDDVVGRTDQDFIDPLNAEIFSRHDQAVLEGRLDERNALRACLAPDGSRRWYIASKLALRSGDGSSEGVVGTFDDVTSLKLVERSLRETTERFELAVRGSSDGLWDWNLLTNEVYYSPRFKSLLGYADHEFGDDFASYEAALHPDDRGLVQAAIAEHIAGGRELDIEYRMRHRSGAWCWYRTRGLAVPDAGGVTTRMAGSLSDITERKAREIEIIQARAHLSEAIEAIDAAIVMFDAGQRLVFCNTRYREIYALSAELACPGVAYRDLLADFCSRFPHLLRGRTFEAYADELFARHRAGGPPWELELPDRWLLLSERPTNDGGVVCLHTDITRQKHSQRALEQALEQAEAANRAKSQFVANVSHELRTPLNGVLGMLQLLGDGGLGAPRDEYVQLALQSGNHLLTLINDVLDFSRNEAGIGEVADEVFSLPLLLDEIVAAHARRALAKRLQLLPFVDPAVPERARGDPARIGQVLANLLSNAIKFTERGEIRVEIRADDATPGILRFIVDDTGIGIPLEVQSTIFDPFTQIDASQTRRFGGAGLGLALTRQQVERMGGRLSLESAAGRGSRFECALRLTPVAGDAPVRLGRVLVVGTASLTRPALVACLQRCGAEVAVVEAPDVATPLASDVVAILLDASLPTDTVQACMRGASASGVGCGRYGEAASDCGEAGSHPRPHTIAAPVSYAAVVAFLRTAATAASPTRILDEPLALRLAQSLGPAGFVELVETFHDSLSQRLADCRDALTHADAVRLQGLAHAMKGVGANLGAVRFAACCAEVERHAARGEVIDRQSVLVTEFEAAVAHLRTLASRTAQREQGAVRA